MTNERAIELLHRLQDEQFDGPHGDERREALEMAVRALEGDGDMISKQAVMKEFSDFVRKSNNSDFAQTPTWNDAFSLVGSMPSAQPEVLACGSGELVKDSQRLVEASSNDMINRQQAIDAHCELCPDQHICCPIHNGNICPDIEVFRLLPSAQPETNEQEQLESAKEYCADCDHNEMCRWYPYEGCEFRSLPSAQPERKKGKCVWCDSPFRIEYYWIDRYGNTASFQDEERHIVATGIAKFCPNCGARMDGESDE